MLIELVVKWLRFNTKFIIKRILLALFGKSLLDVRINSNTKLVSFDIYDTAVFRKVKYPHDIFGLIQKKYDENAEWTYNCDFTYAREKAEIIARKRAKNNDGEVTLEEIYDNITFLSEQEKTLLQSIERDIESKVAYCNPMFSTLYDEIIAQGLPVVFISDMYLSRSDIEKILRTCGIVGYKKVYVSSEIKMNKKKGGLFDYMIKDQNYSPSEVLNIGDKPLGDYLVPKMKGIQSFLYFSNNNTQG